MIKYVYPINYKQNGDIANYQLTGVTYQNMSSEQHCETWNHTQMFDLSKIQIIIIRAKYTLTLAISHFKQWVMDGRYMEDGVSL
jgi:hypothetical protein